MKKILLSTVAFAAIATSASAIEAGKMYVRGDVGYQFNMVKNNYLGLDGKKLKGFTGGIGFGYALSDNVRTDLTLDFSRKSAKNSYKLGAETSYTNGTGTTATTALVAGKNTSSNLKDNTMGLMANVYYDFHNSSGVTPYVMLGLGLERSKKELKFSGKDSADADKSFTIKSKTKNGFAVQFGLGVDYEISQDINIDLGWKIKNTPSKYNYEFGDNQSFTYDGKTYNKDNPLKIETVFPNSNVKNRAFNHTITLGVRFAF